MKHIKPILGIFFFYFLVDVLYQVLIGLKMQSYFLEGTSLKNMISSPPNYPLTIVLFFIIISVANYLLVVKPSLSNQSIKQSLLHGYLLGVAAYSTFSLPLLWLFSDVPLTYAVLVFLFEGSFSMVSSGVVTYFYLRSSTA